MRTPHVRSFFSALEEKTVAYQHFRRPKCAPSHTFFGIAISIPGTTLRNVENWCRRAMHFVFLPELSVHWHQLPIGTRHHKIQRENRLDPRKTGIRHRFVLKIGTSQTSSAKRKARISASRHKKKRADVISVALSVSTLGGSAMQVYLCIYII